MEVETHNTFDQWIDEILHFTRAGDKQTDVKRRELLEKVHDLRVFDGRTPAERSEMSAKLINAMVSFWKYRKETFMGFQASQGLESNKDRLGELLNMQLNNIGDPFYDNSGFRMNCKVAERAVLAYYGLLWCGESELGASVQPGSAHAELPDEKPQRDENATSGYVTCMGSTEGNTYILRQARDYLKGKFLFPKSKRDLENPSPRPKLGAVTVMAKRLQSDEQASITLKFKKAEEASVTSVPVRAKLDGATMVFDARSEREKETGVDSSSASQAFREPILLYSKASHYSIGKIKDMLEIHTPETFMRSKGEGKTPRDVFTKAECDAFFPENRWPSRLPIYEDGTINLGVLKLLVRFFFSKGNPLVVLCNYGTTFTGVYDDPEQVTKIIRADPGVAEEEYTKQQDVDETTISFKRRNYFIACDGALGAAYGSYWEGGPNGSKQRSGPMCTEYLLAEYLQQAANALIDGNAATTQCPYVKVLKSLEAEGFPLTPSEDIILPCFNLRRSDGVMAISMSSHKFLGAPTPGGLVLTVRKYMLDFTGDDVSYIGSPDTSISGSRSGLNVMFLYDYLARHSHAMQIAKFYSAMNLARYAAAHIASEVFGAFPVQVARDKPIHALTPYEVSLRSGDGEEKSNAPAPAVFNFAGSLSVIFPRPEDWIIDKYSLSCDEMRLYKCDGYSFTNEYLESEAGKRLVKEHAGHEILPDGEAVADGEYPKVKRGPYYMLQCAHVFAMGHVTVDMVKGLAADLKTDARLKALSEALSRCNKKA